MEYSTGMCAFREVSEISAFHANAQNREMIFVYYSENGDFCLTMIRIYVNMHTNQIDKQYQRRFAEGTCFSAGFVV